MIAHRGKFAGAYYILALCLVVSILTAQSATHARGHGVSGGGERFDTIEKLLSAADSSDLIFALNDSKKLLEENPDRLELVYLGFEISREQCSQRSWIDSDGVSKSSHGAASLYFLGEAYLNMRSFDKAGKMFSRAAKVSVAEGDTTSCFFSLVRSVECDLFVHSLSGARVRLGLMESLLDKKKSTVVQIFIGLLWAEYYNAVDSLSIADSLYRRILEDGSIEAFPLLRLRALKGLGRLCDKKECISDAEDIYKEALKAARMLSCRMSEAVILNNLGQDEIKSGRPKEGRLALMRAMDIAGDCGEKWLSGYIHYGLGASYEVEGNLSLAVAYFRKAVELHRINSNLWGELGSRIRVAYILSELGDYESALKEYDYCIRKYEDINSRYGLSWAVGGRALCEHRLGLFDEAERDYARCLGLREMLGDKKGASWALRSLGMIYDLKSQYDKALIAYNRALFLSREVNDRKAEGVSLFGIGSSYYYLGKLYKAIDYYKMALDIANDLSDAELKYRALSGLGSAYMSVGKLGSAEDCYIKCFEVSKESSNAVSIIWSSNNLASLYSKMDDRIKARAYLEIAEAYSRMGHFDYLRAQTLYIESTIEPDLKARAEQLSEAATLARKSGLNATLWKALSDLGEIRMMEGKRDEAIRLQEEAALNVEKIAEALGSFEHKGSFLGISLSPFRKLVRYILKGGDAREDIYRALAVSERAREVAAEVLLGNTGSEKKGNESSSGIKKKRSLLSRLSYLQYTLQNPELERMDRIKVLSMIRELEREIEKLELKEGAEAREGYPPLSKIDLETAIESLDDDEVVLSYFLADRYTFLFVVGKNMLKVYRLASSERMKNLARYYLEILKETGPVPREAITELLGNEEGKSIAQYTGRLFLPLTGGLKDSGRIGSSSPLPFNVYIEASRRAFDELIGKAAEALSRAKRIVIVPDAAICDIPFATLIGPEGLLIKNHSIVYAPSIRSLVMLRERTSSRIESKSTGSLGVVSFGCVGARCAGGVGARVFPFTAVPVLPLYCAEREALDVSRHFRNSVVCTGRLAREGEFKRFPLRRAKLIHIASHVYIDDRNVKRSFVVMNEPEYRAISKSPYLEEGSASEDGIMQWKEIAELDLDALLVSLSGCRSARGAMSSGTGVIGLAQAFMHAGSGAVLASLLDVQDQQASRFMDYFYKGVSGGMNFAESLRFAQLRAVREGGICSGPAVWGAFTLIGAGDFSIDEARGLYADGGPSGSQIVAVFLALIIFLLIVYRLAAR